MTKIVYGNGFLGFIMSVTMEILVNLFPSSQVVTVSKLVSGLHCSAMPETEYPRVTTLLDVLKGMHPDLDSCDGNLSFPFLVLRFLAEEKKANRV